MAYGKVQSLLGQTAQTQAVEIRVFFRPSTATDTVRVGDFVCYNSDATTDYDERSTTPISGGTAYAEGSQNYNGRWLIVEKPATANLLAFAGTVSKLGPLAGADGDQLSIYIPNGAIVPVMSDQNCVRDRTIMSVRNGAYEASYPGRPVGIAKETVDRSNTDGLVWAQVGGIFEHAAAGQGDTSTYSLIVDDEAAANNVQLDARSFRFDGTGRARAFYYVGELAGAGNSMWGMFKYRTYLSAAAGSVVHGVCCNLHFKDDATITVTSGHWNSPLYVSVETEVTTTAPTLSGGSVAGISIEYYVDESTAAPAKAYALYVHAGTYNWDGLLAIRNAGDCGDGAMTGDHTFDTADKYIPVDVAGTAYYIPLMNNTGD
jgi:hypothetical protein